MRGHDETDSSDNPGMFQGLVDFVSFLDTVLKEHLEIATVFKGESKTIQNELLGCMLSVTRDKIIRQIKDSDFVLELFFFSYTVCI